MRSRPVVALLVATGAALGAACSGGDLDTCEAAAQLNAAEDERAALIVAGSATP